jgi:hypothetical protein
MPAQLEQCERSGWLGTNLRLSTTVYLGTDTAMIEFVFLENKLTPVKFPYESLFKLPSEK